MRQRIQHEPVIGITSSGIEYEMRIRDDDRMRTDARLSSTYAPFQLAHRTRSQSPTSHDEDRETAANLSSDKKISTANQTECGAYQGEQSS